MSGTLIAIHGVRACYQPGESISGSVEWKAERSPGAISIQLFWMTSGAAARQIGIVECCRVERPDSSGTSRFDFRLPEGPWSFEGSLARLDWVIEAIVVPSEENTHVKFSVGPEGRQPNLYVKEG
jgi:hypothetical protein